MKVPVTAARYDPARKFIKKGAEQAVKSKFGVAPLVAAGLLLGAVKVLSRPAGKEKEREEDGK